SIGKFVNAAVGRQRLASRHEAQARKNWDGMGDVPDFAEDKRKPFEEGRHRSDGRGRPEGSWNRRQPGGIHDVRHRAEQSSSEESRSGRASKTATGTTVRLNGLGLME